MAKPLYLIPKALADCMLEVSNDLGVIELNGHLQSEVMTRLHLAKPLNPLPKATTFRSR